MELSLLLMQKILSMALMIAIGFFITKRGVLKDSLTLSMLSLYLISPSMMIVSFQVDYTREKMIGLLVCFAGAFLAHFIFWLCTTIAGRVIPMKPVEKASLIYSNAGNLIIPLVISILDRESILYAGPFLFVQACMMWTHGAWLMGGKSEISIKKIFTNPNIIAIIVGFSLFLAHIKLPTIIGSTIQGIGDMIGPVSMLIVGNIMAKADLKAALTNKRAYLVCLGRLVVIPLITIVAFRLTGLCRIVPDANRYLLVTVLAVCGPAASSVTAMAQVYNRDYPRASIINILSVLGCIVTIPVMSYIYQLLCF